MPNGPFTQEELRQIHAALLTKMQQGVPVAKLNEIAKSVGFPSVAHLAQRVETRAEEQELGGAAEREALLQLAETAPAGGAGPKALSFFLRNLTAPGQLERLGVDVPLFEREALTPGAISDLLRSAAQITTLGTADELAALGPGGAVSALLGGPAGAARAAAKAFAPEGQERIATSRQRMELLGETSPAATALAGIAGGAALPVAGLLGAGARTAGFLGTLGRSAALGGALGGGFALGEAEGGLRERLPAAAGGALTGAVLGGTLPGIGAAFRVGRETLRNAAGPRIAKLMRELGGAKPLPELRRQAVRGTRETARRVFGPLEARTITRRSFLAFLDAPEIKPFVAAVSKPVALKQRDPSFREMQQIGRAIVNDLERAGGGGKVANFERLRRAADKYMELAEKAVPGYREGRRAYARRLEVEKVLGVVKKGRRRVLQDLAKLPGARVFNAEVSPAQVRAQIANLSDEAADAFRRSAIEVQATRLASARKLPETFKDLTPATREKISILWGERNAKRIADQLIQEVQAIQARRLSGAVLLAWGGYGLFQVFRPTGFVSE